MASLVSQSLCIGLGDPPSSPCTLACPSNLIFCCAFSTMLRALWPSQTCFPVDSSVWPWMQVGRRVGVTMKDSCAVESWHLLFFSSRTFFHLILLSPSLLLHCCWTVILSVSISFDYAIRNHKSLTLLPSLFLVLSFFFSLALNILWNSLILLVHFLSLEQGRKSRENWSSNSVTWSTLQN